MGFMDELKRLSRPYGENDEDFDEDYEGTERRRSRPAQRPAPGKSNAEFDEVLGSLGASGASRRGPSAENGSKVVNINATAQMQVVLVKPDRFDNVSEIADHLRSKHAVVLNLEATSKDISRRLVDFLSGCAYALDGKIKKIAISTYIVTPYNVDIVGDLIDELENSGLYL